VTQAEGAEYVGKYGAAKTEVAGLTRQLEEVCGCGAVEVRDSPSVLCVLTALRLSSAAADRMPGLQCAFDMLVMSCMLRQTLCQSAIRCTGVRNDI
jgi:hypothetical protein